MNTIDLRMDNGLVEKKEDGTTIHVEIDDVKAFYGETVHYILQRQGRVQIVEYPTGWVKRAIIVK